MPGYIYGCPSPLSRLRLAKKNGQIDAHIYDEYLANCIDELTKRLFNILANEAISDLDQAYLKDTIRTQLKTLYVEIDQNIAEKTYEFKEDFMDEDFQEYGYFEILGDIQYEFENAESLVEIDQYVDEMPSEFVADFMDEDFGDTILSDHQSRDGMEKDITDLFKSFNLERNAQRHLSDCFDLAFCAKASESDQSAAHLQAMKDNGVTDIPGVLRDASVDSAQSLYDFTGLSVPELIKTTKRAVKISSYGLLKATLDVIKARNVHITASDWRYMMDDALNRCEPSIIKQCLHIKNKSQRSWLEHFNQNDPVLMRDLLMRSIDMDKYYGKLRSNDYRLQILLDSEVNVNVNVEDTYGNTALISAASIGGFESAVNQLIKAGADVNAKNKRGETALICASMNEHEEVVEELIKARANIYARNNGGVTALMMACDRGHERVVSKLCAAGVDINAKDNTGLTALMIACERGKTVVVEHLLKAIKIDIKAKNEKGETALIIACQTDKLKIVSALMRAGADVFNRGPGKFPSQYANESSNENITNLVNLERQRRIDRISQMQRASREASTASNTNATTQALTELTTAATEIDHQTRPGPSL